MKAIDYMKHPWKWRQPSKLTGKRHVKWHLSLLQNKAASVLFVGDSALYVPDGNGRFVPLTPDNPIARAVESVPDLVLVARLMAVFEADDPELGAVAKQAQKIVAYIEGEHGSAVSGGKPT